MSDIDKLVDRWARVGGAQADLGNLLSPDSRNVVNIVGRRHGTPWQFIYSGLTHIAMNGLELKGMVRDHLSAEDQTTFEKIFACVHETQTPHQFEMMGVLGHSRH